MDGVVTGGWSYVLFAYGVTLFGMVIYGASIWYRSRENR